MERETDNRKKRYRLRRSISDYGRGIAIFLVGICFLFSKQLFKVEYFTDDPWLKYIMGIMCLIYGSFRIWRGKQQDYFWEEDD